MTNIWALTKDEALKVLLLQLLGTDYGTAYPLTKDEALKVLLLLWRDRAAPGTWVLDDTRDGDFKSLWVRGAADSGLRAYVSTHGQGQGRYAVHLEYPSHPGSLGPGDTLVLEDLDADRVMALLHEHLA